MSDHRSSYGQSRWARVNKDCPRPICLHTDWCAVTTDGCLACCQRVEQGAYKIRTGKNGQRYYIHRLNGEQRPHLEVTRHPPGATVERAPTEVLHDVYDALLGQLHLAAPHRDNLRKRGLSDAEIDRRLYRSLPVRGRGRLAREFGERFGRERLLSVPGFVEREKDGQRYLTVAGCAGLVVPCRNIAGRIGALKVRRDDAGDGPRYSYLSSYKHGGPSAATFVHVPLGVATPLAAARIAEDELKADIATALDGTGTLGLPGLAWKPAIPILRQLETKTVFIAFDADAADKPAVAKPLGDCFEGLLAEGFAVEIVRWPASHKGIDDALVGGVAIERLSGEQARAYIAEAMATATAGEPMPAPNPLDRLDQVLDRGAEVFYRDKELLQALAKLAESNPAEFNCCRAKLNKAKIKMRELDAALVPLRQALRAEQPPPTSAGEYKVSGGRIVHPRLVKEGPVEVPLCNFVARIVEQITVDDGAERSVHLAVEGQLVDGTPLPRTEVSVDDFARMDWPIPSWGSKAVVFAGRTTADHLRVAMQLLSGEVPHRVVYGHLGWRLLDKRWIFLHAGGALGENGPIAGIEVVAPEALTNYVLPVPPTGGNQQHAVRASLKLLDLAPDRISFPLLAGTYRSVLGLTDFSLHFYGPTGSFKSEYSALRQQHFGPRMVRLKLPGSWESTDNALEATAFAAKDSLFVVDDFAPDGGRGDVDRLHRKAARLFRAQGNGSGRGRMRPDGSLRPPRPPRGLILSTGEDIPRGHSIGARLFALEIEPNDIPKTKLTVVQHDASEGLYAVSMAGFLRWLAGRYEHVRAQLSADQAELRTLAAGVGQHARTPDIVADLLLGLKYLLQFATEVGAIDADRRAELWNRGESAIFAAGMMQNDHIAAAEPTEHFLRLLRAALASGRAHLAAKDGQYPETPSVWGWREETHNRLDWRPQGRRMGWINDNALFLEPEASYAAAQGMASEQGESLTVSAQTLRKRLKDKGLLVSTDVKRQTLTIRRVLEGASRPVLHLDSSSLLTKPDKPDNDGENTEKMSDSQCQAYCQKTQNPTANTGENGQNVGFVGLQPGRDAPTAGNLSGAAYIAEGLSREDVRTPYDSDANLDAGTPVVPSPAPPAPPRRRGRAAEPDLFLGDGGISR